MIFFQEKIIQEYVKRFPFHIWQENRICHIFSDINDYQKYITPSCSQLDVGHSHTFTSVQRKASFDSPDETICNQDS